MLGWDVRSIAGRVAFKATRDEEPMETTVCRRAAILASFVGELYAAQCISAEDLQGCIKLLVVRLGSYPRAYALYLVLCAARPAALARPSMCWFVEELRVLLRAMVKDDAMEWDREVRDRILVSNSHVGKLDLF